MNVNTIRGYLGNVKLEINAFVAQLSKLAVHESII
ncbi:MAG: hypothetical protein QG641_2384, partial [Candidatus Poribacteria bacterium]|nr:hypothetical protein [Candidatus Poribacteria bacterium]